MLALARNSNPTKAAQKVAELLESGLVQWGFDEQLEVSGLYAIPGQPVSVLMYQGVEVDRWLGTTPAGAWSESLEELLRRIVLPADAD